MTLKYKISSLDDVDEAHKSLYIKSGEDYVLDVSGATAKESVDEFRNNNIQLKEQIEKLQKDGNVSEGVIAELQKTLEEKEQKLTEMSDQNKLDEGDIEGLLNARTERMRQEFNSQTEVMKKALDEKDQKLGELDTRLRQALVSNTVMSVVNEAGVPRQGAMTDIMQRASNTWKLEDDGSLVARKENGDTLYGNDGRTKITPLEWITGLRNDAPFLFETNSGGNTGGSDNSGQENKPGPLGENKIDVNDKKAIAANLDAIAKGEMTIVSGE